jgi:glycosyltransferase involved in cell wall biosynthesis
VRFSIITPSFRSANWLKLCIASVADQNVDHEHIVQDAGSDDGTLDWLPTDPRVRAFVEKDQGMYDAINRGLRRSNGDILAYLNCDEQYLPGALKSVQEFFASHPEIELLFADFVVVDGQGEYLFHRKVQVPLKHHLWISHLPAFSCAMFFRRHLVHDEGFWFDPSWRDVGDGEWVLRLLRRNTRVAVMRRFTSVFTMSGANMSIGENAKREARRLHATAPSWMQKARPLIIAQHRLRRLMGGIYRQSPFTFELYTQKNPEARVARRVNQPTYRWRIS